MADLVLGGIPIGTSIDITVTSGGETKSVTGVFGQAQMTPVGAASFRGRLMELDVAQAGASGPVSVTVPTPGAPTQVLANGNIGVDLHDVSAGQDLEFTFSDATNALFVVTLNVGLDVTEYTNIGPATIKGWGPGQHFLIPWDGGTTPPVTQLGEKGIRVYVSNAPDALTLADIAADAGVPVNQVGGYALYHNSTFASYGRTEATKLDGSVGGIGWQLWEYVKDAQLGSQLYLERGYDYPDMGVERAVGVSPIYPAMVSTFGTGARPKVAHPIVAGPIEFNMIWHDVDLPHAYQSQVLLSNSGPYLAFLGVESTSEFAVQFGVGPVTISGCYIHEAHHDTPQGGDDWDDGGPNANRKSGLYIAGGVLGGLLLENTYVDHCGWAPGYLSTPQPPIGTPHPPSNRSHNIYLASMNDATVRNLISTRSSSIGMSNGPAGIIDTAILVDNPIGWNVRSAGLQPNVGNKSGINGDYTLAYDVITQGTIHIPATYSVVFGWGSENQAPNATFDRCITANMTETTAGGPGLFHKSDTPPLNDNTIVYNWRQNKNVVSEPLYVDKNVDTLETSDLDLITSVNFMNDRNGVSNSTKDDFYAEAASAFETATIGELAKAFAAYSHLMAFNAGAVDFAPRVQHSTAQSMTFNPDPRGDGRRWSVLYNWLSGDVPIHGDNLNTLGWTTHMDMSDLLLGDLTLGTGNLNVFGRLGYTGTLSADGATIHAKGSGDFTLNGWSAPERLALSCEGGRVTNAGTVTGNLSISVTHQVQFTHREANPGSWFDVRNLGVAVLALSGQSCTISAGETLRLHGNSIGALDGVDGGTATLTLDAGATLEMSAEAYQYEVGGVIYGDGQAYSQQRYVPRTGVRTNFGVVREMRTGHHDITAPNVTSVVALNGCTLNVDLSELVRHEYLADLDGTVSQGSTPVGAALQTVIDVDTLTGSFGAITATGLDSAFDLEVTVNTGAGTVAIEVQTGGTGAITQTIV